MNKTIKKISVLFLVTLLIIRVSASTKVSAAGGNCTHANKTFYPRELETVTTTTRRVNITTDGHTGTYYCTEETHTVSGEWVCYQCGADVSADTQYRVYHSFISCPFRGETNPVVWYQSGIQG